MRHIEELLNFTRWSEEHFHLDLVCWVLRLNDLDLLESQETNELLEYIELQGGEDCDSKKSSIDWIENQLEILKNQKF